MFLIDDLFCALILTLAVETVVAFLFGFRKERELIAVVCINLITNPAFNYLLLSARVFHLFPVNFYVVWFLEILIIIVEWRLLYFALRGKSSRLLVLSIFMNLSSYVAGLLIFH